MIVLQAFFVATKWSTTSDRLNVLINWLAIAGYELLFCSSPVCLPDGSPSPSAAILLVPLFASQHRDSSHPPLRPRLHQDGSHRQSSFLRRRPMDDIPGRQSGVDIDHLLSSALRFHFSATSSKPFLSTIRSATADAASAITLPGNSEDRPWPLPALGPLRPPEPIDKILPLH